ncbi:hypothetical protein KRMM14A1259_48650 [Krasilnikovia sp. MM14-A1259]
MVSGAGTQRSAEDCAADVPVAERQAADLNEAESEDVSKADDAAEVWAARFSGAPGEQAVSSSIVVSAATRWTVIGTMPRPPL